MWKWFVFQLRSLCKHMKKIFCFLLSSKGSKSYLIQRFFKVYISKPNEKWLRKRKAKFSLLSKSFWLISLVLLYWRDRWCILFSLQQISAGKSSQGWTENWQGKRKAFFLGSDVARLYSQQVCWVFWICFRTFSIQPALLPHEFSVEKKCACLPRSYSEKSWSMASPFYKEHGSYLKGDGWPQPSLCHLWLQQHWH